MAVGDPTNNIPVPADTWTVVATNVTSGQISITDPITNNWYWTQWSTGSPAPTIEVPFRKFNFQNLIIDSSVAIDVYVYHKGSAGVVGVV